MTDRLSFLPDAEDVARDRLRQGLQKGRTRLEEKAERKPLTKVDDKAFKAEVWTRDKSHCRCCGRKVQKVVGLVPERGEVHHVHGRGGELRFEPRSALLLCLTCHQRVTGKVNDKLVIVGTVFFELIDKSGPHRYIDARQPVTFQRVA